MRITRSASFVVKQLTNTIVKKAALVSFGFVLLASGVMLGQNLLTTPQAAHAITPPDACFAFDTATGTITDYYSYEGNTWGNPACTKSVDIPETIGGVNVATIGINAFRYSYLTSISIPSTVTSIGDGAFQYNNFSSISVPGTVTTFGIDLFKYNSLLTSVTYNGTTHTFPSPVTEQCFSFAAGSITKYLYLDMSNLRDTGAACFARDVDIPSTIGGTPVTTIGASAFASLGLTSVTIPNSVTIINASAFSNNQLTSVTIPSGVTTIGNSAFSNNRLTSAPLPSSLTTLGTSAFASNQLTEVTVPGGVATIRDSAFSNNRLTSVTLSSGLININDWAFYANQITSITLPPTLVTVGGSVFRDNQLTAITVPSSVTTMWGNAFGNNKLTTVVFEGSLSTIGTDIFPNNPITSITYNGTTYVTPTGTTTPPELCFNFTTATKSITRYRIYDIKLMQSNGVGCMAREVTVPSTIGGLGVENISASAFSSKQLTSIQLPSTLITVGSNAFSSNLLSSAVVPEGVTLIGDYAFAYNQLDSLTIPNTITTISYGAFSNNQLSSLSLPSTLTAIDGRAFYANKLTSVNVPDSLATIDPSAFALQSEWGRTIAECTDGLPCVWSSDPAIVQSAYDAIWYARLHTASPSNPSNLEHSTLSEDYWWGSDANANGRTTDSLGGHIINPVTVVTHYVSTNGQKLNEPTSSIGETTAHVPLTGYRVTETAIPAPLDPYSPTPSEQTALTTGFNQYYHTGGTFTVIAPTSIGGRPLYGPTTPHTFTITSTSHQLQFTYGEPRTTIDFAAPTGSPANPSSAPAPSDLTQVLTASTLTAGGTQACAHVESASLLAASDFTAPDPSYTTLGGLHFSINCTTPGGEADVSFSLGGAFRDLGQVKVYKQNSLGVVTDITPQVSLTNRTSDQGTKTVIQYIVQDGQQLDDDNVVNGTILDPIYVVAPPSAVIDLASGSGKLAATGMPFWAAIAGALALLASGARLIVARTGRG